MNREDYLRVTDIIKPFSGVEFVPEDILNVAAKKGTRVHKYIENILKGEDSYIFHEEDSLYVDSFKVFWEKSSHAFKGGNMILEQRLFCDELQITGQADVIIEMQDRTYIIDWKTSKSTHKSWALQGCAYKYLAEKSGFKNVDSVLFVKLKSDGKPPSLHKHEKHEENLEIFVKCLELYKWFDMKNTRKFWE